MLKDLIKKHAKWLTMNALQWDAATRCEDFVVAQTFSKQRTNTY